MITNNPSFITYTLPIKKHLPEVCSLAAVTTNKPLPTRLNVKS